MADLSGRRILITRAPEDAARLAALVRARGGVPLVFPCLERAPPEDLEPLDRLWAERDRFDRFVVGSPHALTPFGGFPEPSRRVPVACVGPKTAAAVEASPELSARFTVAEVAADRRAEGLAAALKASLGAKDGLRGRAFAFPRAAEGREALVGLLEAEGATVEAVVSYRLRLGDLASAEALEAVASADVLTFLSGRTLEGFLARTGPRGRGFLERAVVAVIGPVAKARAAELGVRVDVVPEKASAEALLDALAAL